jgi:hypothetical protein
MTPDHISHTQIQMLLKCGIQYEFRYVNGKIAPPSASLVRGKCGHKTLEKNFKQKIESKQDLPVDELKDTFSDEWEKSKYEIAWKTKEMGDLSPAKAGGIFKDSGIAMIGKFHEEQSPVIYPVAVEDPFEILFEGGYPKLIGFTDRIDEGEEIGEVKFVSKSPNADDARTDIQLTIEEFGYRMKYGRPPKKLKKQFAISTKEPKTLSQEVEHRDDATINRLMWRIQASMMALQKGVLTPAPHGAWWCSENWCGYWNQCKYRP